MFSKTYTLIIYYISVPSPGTERTTYRQPFDSAYGAKAMTSAGRSQKCIGTKIPVFIRSMNCWAPRIKSVPTYTENRRKLVGITDPNWNQQKSQKLSFVLSGFTELKKCGPEIVDKL